MGWKSRMRCCINIRTREIRGPKSEARKKKKPEIRTGQRGIRGKGTQHLEHFRVFRVFRSSFGFRVSDLLSRLLQQMPDPQGFRRSPRLRIAATRGVRGVAIENLGDLTQTAFGH